MKEKKDKNIGKIIISIAVTLALSVPITIAVTNNIITKKNFSNNNSTNVYVDSEGNAIDLGEYNNIENENKELKDEIKQLKEAYNDLEAKYEDLEKQYSASETETSNDTETNESSDEDGVYLMKACPPYDIMEGKSLFESNATFKMSGETYSNGFTYASPGSVEEYVILFNLKGEYSRMEFDCGHVDDSGMYDATINIVLDDQVVKTIEKKADDLVTHEIVELNNAKQLKIGFNTGGAGRFGHYGLANIKIYK